MVRPNSNEYGHLQRVVNLHLAIKELADLFATNAPALAICDDFLGAETALYTSLYFERGSEQTLHRDTPYFCTKPRGKYLGLWLALDDVDEDNGPLRLVPKSHLLPPLDLNAMRIEVFGGGPIPPISQEGWNRYQSEVQHQCDERGMKPIDVHVSRGDAIIWHPETFHGGAPHNVKRRSRRSLVAHVTPIGVPVYHMDVFFDSERRVSDHASWSYLSHGNGRKIAEFDRIDFGHEYTIELKKLRAF
jgi:ectoine hydroxylase-related dioxygenase (phytanoyl-CoA dioxygenase family)